MGVDETKQPFFQKEAADPLDPVETGARNNSATNLAKVTPFFHFKENIIPMTQV